MSSQKFSKPTVIASKSDTDKEKLADQFINFMPAPNESVEKANKLEKGTTGRVTSKEQTKGVFLRFPETLRDDLAEISNITGLSINAICLELLRPQVRSKLKDLKEN